MNIIKEGRLPPPVVLRGVCEKCGCEIECFEHEARQWDEDLQMGYFSCPTQRCHQIITMYVKDSLLKKKDQSV